jgi:hypothetical protein
MSDKPIRARRAPNRHPTSLAIAISSPDPPIIESSLDPLRQIDPQLEFLTLLLLLVIPLRSITAPSLMLLLLTLRVLVQAF